jgi:hypothetical protein
MPDETRPIILESQRTRTGIFEHFCERHGCKKWGGWGYSRGKVTIWYCSEHRAEGERQD